MDEIVKTMKLRLQVDKNDINLLGTLTQQYMDACTYISQYIFDHDFILNSNKIQDKIYGDIRLQFGLKSQFAISAIKTVTAKYKTVKEHLYQHPYKYQDENGKWCYITRTLDWLWKPVVFHRPQADFVRGRDYSFVKDKATDKFLLSLNTLNKRIKVSFDLPEYFASYLDGSWSFGTGKIVSLNSNWYFHIPMTKAASELDADSPTHIIGIDRGLRFLVTAYDEKGKTTFIDGKAIMDKRDSFKAIRAELQSRGTKSAKRALKRISGRENRWMSDVNHRISKTLVSQYGPNTLFVLENLQGVSFDEQNLSNRNREGRYQLRSWAFYQLEQDLIYKAAEVGSSVIKVAEDYTSQRCPKCGRIHKENRNHKTHEYVCDRCGYRTNDDRIAAMNIQTLGTMYVSGDSNPRFGPRKIN